MQTPLLLRISAIYLFFCSTGYIENVGSAPTTISTGIEKSAMLMVRSTSNDIDLKVGRGGKSSSDCGGKDDKDVDVITSYIPESKVVGGSGGDEESKREVINKLDEIMRAPKTLEPRKRYKPRPDDKDKNSTKEGNLNKLDADNAEDLIKRIKKLHESFAKSPTYKDEPDITKIRPLFVSAKVANEAFAKWTGVADSQPCKDKIVDVIFSTPKECMKKLDPKNMPKVANEPRLVAREQCITTDVRCVEEAVFEITAKDLLKEIKKQWEGVEKAVLWVPKMLFAPQKVVEEAWELWSKDSLGGKGYKSKEGICGRPKRIFQVKGGSLIAIFAQNDKCVGEDAAATCKDMVVECL